jgi:hypothetical protein
MAVGIRGNYLYLLLNKYSKMAKKSSKNTKSKTSKGLSAKSASKVSIRRSTGVIKSKRSGVIFRPDTKQTASLVRIGRNSTLHAIRESKALGLTITYMENGVLYRELPDGTKEVLNAGEKKIVKRKIGSILIRKGIVLHAKK